LIWSAVVFTTPKMRADDGSIAQTEGDEEGGFWANLSMVRTVGKCSPRHRMPLKQETRVQNAFDDVASTMHQSLIHGAREVLRQSWYVVICAGGAQCYLTVCP
jgi:hypothetical protein